MTMTMLFRHDAAPAGGKGTRVGPVVERVALIGNYLPRLCGIATFTADVYEAVTGRFPSVAVDVYAMNDGAEDYDYPPAVVGTIEQDDPYSYLDAARCIQDSDADILFLQHEYGIFGGPAGDLILKLIERVRMPVVTHLHTVLERPNDDQCRVMKALIARSARLIVMAERGRELLKSVYGATDAQIVVVPHGVHDRPADGGEAMKAKLGLAGHDVLLTFGLLSPGKGIETMIQALPEIVAADPDSLYVVLGATHPQLVAREGEAYRYRLMEQAESLGVASHIRWIDAFLETPELLDYLEAADIYVTPYLNEQQMTSGTLSYAVGLGKAVVSTPYIHAVELLADDHGRLVPFGDSAGFAREIGALLSDRPALAALRRRSYALGRTMIWPRLAEAVVATFDQEVEARPVPLRAARIAPPIPEAVAFDAVDRLSDSTGMIQHSIHGVPDRRHGYCVDDNARALILMCARRDLSEELYDRWTPVFASFVQHAWNSDRTCFRNFMSFERTWLEEEGSEDSSARALWSIGVAARDARHGTERAWALDLFNDAIKMADGVGSPRTHAFITLASVAVLDVDPTNKAARRAVEAAGAALMTLLDKVCRPDWAWFEIVLAYDNCRLPEALIRAGLALDRQDFVDRGLESLEWIVAQQTAKAGHFRPVGSESFGRPFSPPLPFDQQPLEAWATVDACVAAFTATGDAHWQAEGLRAYRWFQGENDLKLPVASPEDGECFDGLMPDGLNQNRGAESVLAFHLATTAIKSLLQGAQIEQKIGLARQ